MRFFCCLVLALGAHTGFADVGTRSVGLQSASGLQDKPAVATWNGVTWAAWLDTSDSRYFDTTRVVISRLAPNGTPLDQPGVALPLRASSALPPHLGVCGGQLWAMWPSDGLTIEVHLSIGSSGSVTEAKDVSDPAFAEPTVVACVLKQLKAVKFGPSPDGQPVEVTYPFVFQVAK